MLIKYLIWSVVLPEANELLGQTSDMTFLESFTNDVGLEAIILNHYLHHPWHVLDCY